MSYPVDMESVKNTKLFKKFMESKNKSISISEPKMQNVDINIKFQSKQIESQSIAQKPIPQKSQLNKYNSSPRVHQRQFENPNKKFAETNYQKQTYEASKINNDMNVYEKQRQELVKQDNYTYENLQRKTEPMNRQKANSKDKFNFEKKYEKLIEQYNELKEKVSVQRKEYRKEMIKLEEQAEMLNKKVFQLRSKQDELILENKRLKEKSQAETKQRQAFQQSNRQLSFQVQQLKDMLDGQSNSSKKKQDETSHWRKINDDLRQKIRQLQSQISKQKDLINMMERQKFVMEKQVSNKQLHLNQMREKINSLITENGVLRDQIFHITSKLYQFQQQNKSLKADLRRHSDDFPMSYLQQKLQQASRYSRPQQQGLSSSFQQNKSEVIHDAGQKRTQRRRGEFARQRGMRRVEQNQEQKQMNTPSVQQNIASTNMTQNSKQIGQAVRKLEQLNQELQKLKDSKAMNGTMRRQKINLQREIQEIQEFLKNKQ